MKNKDSERLKKAKEFSETYLNGKTRRSGELYTQHLQKLVKEIERTGIKDDVVLISALLYHVDKSKDELIIKEFGGEVFSIIESLRKLTEIDISLGSPKKSNDKYFLQTYLNLVDDIRVMVVRLIDKSVSVKSAHKLDFAESKETAEKALYLYSPVARILGLLHTASQLENEAFKILFPNHYYNIKRVVEKKKGEIKTFFKDAIPFLQTTLKESGIDSEIKTRIKHYYSIFRKSLHYSSQGMTTDDEYQNIYDIAGMRILVKTEEECYLTESILKTIWECYEDKRDDYIKFPKPSGYKSLHNIFKINNRMNLEIQIRTHEMHSESEFGTASHFFYKVGGNLKTQIMDNPNWLKEINFWEVQNTKEKETKLPSISKFVYAFTPKGDIIELPRGANIIDFAYYVHTKLGHNCVGGKVNGNIVKLDYEIKDGDRIEILTGKADKLPSRDWLKIAKTRRVINVIRKALGLTSPNLGLKSKDPKAKSPKPNLTHKQQALKRATR